MNVSRRGFLATVGASGVAAALSPRSLCAWTARTPQSKTLMGTGNHTYEWVKGWPKLPQGVNYGNTHGCIVVDSKGRVFVNTDTERAVIIFDVDGNFLGSWGKEFAGGLHGMCHSKEGDKEFLYLTHLGRHEVAKSTLQGEILWVIGYPKTSGIYQDANGFLPTSVAVAPNGDFYVADGYGASWVHRFNAKNEYVSSFGGPGTDPGKMQTPHGIWLDTRGATPSLLVADRENGRLQIFDLEGKLLGMVTEELRRPCHMHQHMSDLVIADLAGRVTILDKDNKLITHLGDNPDPNKRAQNGIPPAEWVDGEFISPHCARFDAQGNLYVMDWLSNGRITKLRRVKA